LLFASSAIVSLICIILVIYELYRGI
jgi:hypothetical protein